MLNQLISYFQGDGRPTIEGLKAFNRVVTSLEIDRIVVLTDAEYAALTPDARTLYITTG